MDENILARNIQRKSDRFIEDEHEPDHRVHLGKLEVFRSNDFKPEPVRNILKPPVNPIRILKVKPVRPNNHQEIYRPEVIRSKISRLAPYDIARTKNKPKMLNQLP